MVNSIPPNIRKKTKEVLNYNSIFLTKIKIYDLKKHDI